ncbi:MAG: hypothetical protein M3Q71_15195 [Chloroflexota bacterium]|nr:hypothetical protein [Chloroflexota bacterium]
MSNQPDPHDDRATRVREARQVFAGDELQAPSRPLDFGAEDALVNPTQRTYLIVLAALLVVALLLFAIWGLGVASPILLLLALALLAGWVIF